MKKLFILSLLALCAGLHAKSLKQRVADLEEKVALLGRNEEESWKELKRMDKEVAQLENREFSRIQDAPEMLTVDEAGEEL